MKSSSIKPKVALTVGIYDTVVGLWPLLSMTSFTNITGLAGPVPLIKMLGASWALLGVALLFSSKKKDLITPLGAASTVAGSTLAITQVVLVAMRIISPIFLLQALAETTIGITWMLTLTGSRNPGHQRTSQSTQGVQAH